MIQTGETTLKRSRSLLFTFCALALTALLVPAAGIAAKHGKKKDPKVTVMTRNLYLGADLGPAIAADGLPAAIDAAGQIVGEVDESDFPERAKLLAKEIAKAKPDLLGLQELALWKDQVPSDLGAPPLGIGEPATHVRYDFLKSLQKELKARNANYKVAAIQNEFSAELPADTDGDDGTGTFAGADLDGSLTMRDAILVRKGGKVKVSKPDSGNFDTRYEPVVGGITIPVDRGWVSVEAKVKGNKRTKGASFRFVDTHLESFGDPMIREDQARELFAKGGPLRTKKQVVLLGDLNSGGPKDKVGTGFTTPGDEGAYNALVDDFGMTNIGTRQTCCYPDVFEDAIGDYRFDHTVDHVMAKPKLRQVDSYVTGGDPSVTGAGGVVSSDHGGLVSKLKLSR
jgi:endonuclease/exonuclease/phosphatase family metal-dependent hydrolase